MLFKFLVTLLTLTLSHTAPLGTFWKCILSNEEELLTSNPKFIIGQHLDTTVLKGKQARLTSS